MPSADTEIRVSEPAQLIWDVIEEISRDRVRQYAQASGDRNTIHIDPDAAHRAGLADPVAHGILILALILRHADEWTRRNGARITGCDTRFIRPVYVGDVATLLHLTGRCAAPGQLTATATVLGPDGAPESTVMRPIRIRYETV